MTLYEVLAINKEMINRLQAFGAKADDWRYLDLYRDYQRMHQEGDKVTYIVRVSDPARRA